jgi:proteasome activator subunit 3 (PA28 gamma)
MSHETRKRAASTGKNAVPPVISESDTQLNDYKTQVKKQAETVFRDIFPKKILELNALLESDILSLKRLADIGVKLNIPVPEPKLVEQEPIAKKRKADCLNDTNDNDVQGTQVILLPNGLLPINGMIAELIGLVKPQAIELIGYANQIKMWINFMIPKIEDGNNFGVSIQEDSMGEARQVESEAASYLDQISRYYLTRGKIISKVAKYPHVEDYRRTITELDEKEFLSLKLVVTELRNHYASLHDLISKNIEKIKKPRSTNNTDNMY